MFDKYTRAESGAVTVETGKFKLFQEACRESFALRGTQELIEERAFQARLETLQFNNGASVIRVTSTPNRFLRVKQDISYSDAEYLYASLVLEGTVAVEQHGITNLEKSGELIVFDNTRPSTVTNGAAGKLSTKAIGLIIPKAALTAPARDRFTNVLFTRDSMLVPLHQSLMHISNRMLVASSEEVSSVFDACLSLLPVAAGCFNHGEALGFATGSALWRNIQEYINDNLSDGRLSAVTTASALSLSVRYIHKLFALRGGTFSAFVTEKRLSRVRAEITYPSNRSEPIALIAFRWGFNDLSTFNRAFKKRYGVAPSVLRSAFGS